MVTNSPSLISSVNKVNYEVGIKKLKNGKYQTFVLEYPSLKASANSKDEAIKKLSKRIQDFLKDIEIVTLEIEINKPEDPWMKFAGMFKDDPLFDQVLEAIQDYRNEIDAEEEE
jgi:predicted RNase H-like HicB family nuclease